MATVGPTVNGAAVTATNKPVRKVTVGAVTGSVVIVGVWVLDKFANIKVGSDVSAAATTILSFIAAYFTPPAPHETTLTQDGTTISAQK